MCVFFFFNCLLPHFFCLLYVDACLFSCLVLSSYFVSFFVFCVDFSLVHCLLFFFFCCCCFFPLSPCRIDAQFRTVTAERCCLFFFFRPPSPFFFFCLFSRSKNRNSRPLCWAKHIPHKKLRIPSHRFFLTYTRRGKNRLQRAAFAVLLLFCCFQ